MSLPALFLFFAIIYFVQGFASPNAGIASRSIFFVLKDEMGFTVSQTAEFINLMLFAWYIKPFFGSISDNIPILGYRRKSYLLITTGLSSATWYVLFSLGEYRFLPLLTLLMICSLGIAFSDVLCDAVMVERGQELGKTGKFQSIQWSSYMVAAVLSGVIGGWLAERRMYKEAFVASAAFLVLTFAAIIAIFRESRVEVTAEQRAQRIGRLGKTTLALPLVLIGILLYMLGDSIGLPLPRAVTAYLPYLIAMSVMFYAIAVNHPKPIPRAFLFVILFLFLWFFSPSFGTPLNYRMVDELKFSKEFVGQLDSISSVGSMLGALVFYVLQGVPIKLGGRISLQLGEVAPKRILYGLVPVGVVTTLLYLYFVDATTAVVITFLGGMVGMISMLAALNIAARTCPKGVEGTIFAAVMALLNISQTFSSLVGSHLYEYYRLSYANLVLISAGATAAILPLIPFLKLTPGLQGRQRR